MIGSLLSMRYIGKQGWWNSLKFALIMGLIGLVMNRVLDLIIPASLVNSIVWLILSFIISVHIGVKYFGIKKPAMKNVAAAAIIVDFVFTLIIVLMGLTFLAIMVANASPSAGLVAFAFAPNNAYVGEINAPFTANPGQTITVNVGMYNPMSQATGTYLEVCVFPINWQNIAFTATPYSAISTSSCCPANDFCKAMYVSLGTGDIFGGEPDYQLVPVQVKVPSATSVDGCHNLGSAYNPAGQYMIVAGTYGTCSTGYTSSERTALTVATTSSTTTTTLPTCSYGTPCTVNGCPGSWECTPNKFCKDIPNDNCPNTCTAGAACQTTAGCPGQRVCPANTCADIPNDNCPVVNQCTPGVACVMANSCPGTITCPGSVCTDTPNDGCPTGSSTTTTTIQNCVSDCSQLGCDASSYRCTMVQQGCMKRIYDANCFSPTTTIQQCNGNGACEQWEIASCVDCVGDDEPDWATIGVAVLAVGAVGYALYSKKQEVDVKGGKKK